MKNPKDTPPHPPFPAYVPLHEVLACTFLKPWSVYSVMLTAIYSWGLQIKWNFHRRNGKDWICISEKILRIIDAAMGEINRKEIEC